MGVALIAEKGFDAGGLVAKGQAFWTKFSGEEVGEFHGVVRRLLRDG